MHHSHWVHVKQQACFYYCHCWIIDEWYNSEDYLH